MDNVVEFPNKTFLRDNNESKLLPVKNVLDGVINEEIDKVFVIGLKEDGELYLAGNIASLSTLVFMLERAKLKLLTSELTINV